MYLHNVPVYKQHCLNLPVCSLANWQRHPSTGYIFVLILSLIKLLKIPNHRFSLSQQEELQASLNTEKGSGTRAECCGGTCARESLRQQRHLGSSSCFQDMARSLPGQAGLVATTTELLLQGSFLAKPLVLQEPDWEAIGPSTLGTRYE